MNNASIDVLATAGVAPVELFLFGPITTLTFVPLTVGTPLTVTGLEPGVFTVIVTDGSTGSPFTGGFTILNITPNMNVAATPGFPVDNSNCAIPDGEIQIDVTGGTGSFSYSWTGPGLFSSTSEDISGLAGGTYAVTVSDDGTNCSRVEMYTITDPFPTVQNVTTPSPQTVCSTDDVTLDLDNSEIGTVYEILVNGAPSGFFTVSLAVGPLSTTINSGNFSNGDILTVEASFGNCTPVLMNNSIIVIVVTAPDPGIDNTVSACDSDAAFDLFASLGGTPDAGGSWTDLDGSGGVITGNNINFTTVTPGMSYRYEYTVTGMAPCPDEMAIVTVNLIAQPDAGLDNTVAACNDDTAFDLFGNLLGTPDAGGSWADLDGSGGVITGNDIDFTGVTGGMSYRFEYTVTGTAPCVDATAIVTVNLNQAANPGIDNTVSACDSDAAFDLFASLGGTPDAGGSWTDLDGSGGVITGNNINFTTVTPGMSYRYEYTVTGMAPCPDEMAIVTVNLVTDADAGMDNTVSACNDETAFDLFASLLGTPDAGGTWTDLDGSGGVITGDNIDLTSVGAGSFRFEYLVSPPAPCTDATAIVTVNVVQAANPGVDNTVSACDSDAAFDLFASLGGTPDAGGSWTDLDGSGGTITGNDIDFTSVTPGMSYRFEYMLLGAPTCIDVTAIVTVNLIRAPDPGVDNTVSACNDDTAFDLFANLSGTPDAGGSWFDLDASGGTISGDDIDFTGVLAGSYRFQYTVSGTPPCVDNSAIVTVNLTQEADAGVDNTVVACDLDLAFDLFASLNGTPDAGGSWADLDGSSGVITGNTIDFTAVTPGMSYRYEYTVTRTAPCTDDMAIVTVNLVSNADAGLDNTVAACNDDSAFDLFGSLGGTPDPLGIWTDLDGSGGTITGNDVDLTLVIAGSYRFEYLVTSPVPCTDASAIVTVNVTQAADAGIDNTVTGCDQDTAFDLFASLGGTPDAGGSWIDLDGSGGVITGNDINLMGVWAGSYRFEYTVTTPAPCTDDMAIVTVNVTQAADAGVDNTMNACSIDTSFDLFVSLGGTPAVGGSWADLDGSGGVITGNTIDFTPVTPGMSYRYEYTVLGVATCLDATAIVTVNLTTPVDAGIDNTTDACNNDMAFDLLGSLGGTPDSGGAWTDLDGSGGVITGDDIDLTSVAAGSYRFEYLVAAAAPCLDDIAVLTLNVVDTGVLLTQDAIGLCPGVDISFTTTPGFDLYRFINVTTGMEEIAANPSNTGTISGLSDGNIIHVIAVSAICGSFNDQVVVSINPTATISLTQDAIGQCPSQSIGLTASSGFDTYEFRDGVGGATLSGPTTSNQFSSSNFTDGQVIEVLGTSAVCGSVTATVSVSINSFPTLALTQDNTGVCPGVSLGLTATSGFDTYEFRDGVGGATLSGPASTNQFSSINFTNSQVIEVEAVSAICGIVTATLTIDLLDDTDPSCSGPPRNRLQYFQHNRS